MPSRRRNLSDSKMRERSRGTEKGEKIITERETSWKNPKYPCKGEEGSRREGRTIPCKEQGKPRFTEKEVNLRNKGQKSSGRRKKPPAFGRGQFTLQGGRPFPAGRGQGGRCAEEQSKGEKGSRMPVAKEGRKKFFKEKRGRGVKAPARNVRWEKTTSKGGVGL